MIKLLLVDRLGKGTDDAQIPARQPQRITPHDIHRPDVRLSPQRGMRTSTLLICVSLSRMSPRGAYLAAKGPDCWTNVQHLCRRKQASRPGVRQFLCRVPSRRLNRLEGSSGTPTSWGQQLMSRGRKSPRWPLAPGTPESANSLQGKSWLAKGPCSRFT
jgi:hypothetical protein